MIEGIPVGAILNGLGTVSVVVLAGLLLWRALTRVPKDRLLPALVTGREAETYLKRAEKAEGNVEVLVATVADLTAVSKLQKAAIDAGLRVASGETGTST